MRRFRSGQYSSSNSRAAAPVRYESIIPNPKAKLPDQLREVMRLKRYSIRAERTYCDWLRRYVKFHQMKSRDDLFPPESKSMTSISRCNRLRSETTKAPRTATQFCRPASLPV
ncbi:MAG TPA: phage integrase N-terminal SAM-like domain-containing protein [Clostridia bacterium]|nr:phage integrase N-terminal SAM-like domain-containing protein [Clostridia bacterium]